MVLVVGTSCGLVTEAPTSNPTGSSVFTIDRLSTTIKVTTTNAIKVTEMGWWCDTASQESNFEVGIYDHDAVNDWPGDLLYAERINAKGTTTGWKRRSGLDWDLNASTIYWLAVQVDNTATITKVDKEDLVGERYAESYNLAAQSTLLDSFIRTWSSDDKITAIYAVWESAPVKVPRPTVAVGNPLIL